MDQAAAKLSLPACLHTCILAQGCHLPSLFGYLMQELVTRRWRVSACQPRGAGDRPQQPRAARAAARSGRCHQRQALRHGLPNRTSSGDFTVGF